MYMPFHFSGPDKFLIVNQAHAKAEVAQSVEQGTENPRVSGSIPFLGTNDYKSNLVLNRMILD